MDDKRCCPSQLRSRLRRAHTKAIAPSAIAYKGCAGDRLSLLRLGTSISRASSSALLLLSSPLRASHTRTSTLVSPPPKLPIFAMAPIAFAAAPQDATAQQTAPVNEERNPQVGNYLACTISRKETAAELVDEERNPQVGNYLACIIA